MKFWTWNLYSDCYPWTWNDDDELVLKVWANKEDAIADVRKEWSDDAPFQLVAVEVQTS